VEVQQTPIPPIGEVETDDDDAIIEDDFNAGAPSNAEEHIPPIGETAYAANVSDDDGVFDDAVHSDAEVQQIYIAQIDEVEGSSVSDDDDVIEVNSAGDDETSRTLMGFINTIQGRWNDIARSSIFALRLENDNDIMSGLSGRVFRITPRCLSMLEAYTAEFGEVMEPENSGGGWGFGLNLSIDTDKTREKQVLQEIILGISPNAATLDPEWSRRYFYEELYAQLVGCSVKEEAQPIHPSPTDAAAKTNPLNNNDGVYSLNDYNDDSSSDSDDDDSSSDSDDDV
jgi:hypothetical protein